MQPPTRGDHTAYRLDMRDSLSIFTPPSPAGHQRGSPCQHRLDHMRHAVLVITRAAMSGLAVDVGVLIGDGEGRAGPPEHGQIVGHVTERPHLSLIHISEPTRPY